MEWGYSSEGCVFTWTFSKDGVKGGRNVSGVRPFGLKQGVTPKERSTWSGHKSYPTDYGI